MRKKILSLSMAIIVACNLLHTTAYADVGPSISGYQERVDEACQISDLLLSDKSKSDVKTITEYAESIAEIEELLDLYEETTSLQPGDLLIRNGEVYCYIEKNVFYNAETNKKVSLDVNTKDQLLTASADLLNNYITTMSTMTPAEMVIELNETYDISAWEQISNITDESQLEIGDAILKNLNGTQVLFFNLGNNVGIYESSADNYVQESWVWTSSTVVYRFKKEMPTYTVPTGLQATYGDKLSNITLPNGFVWDKPDQKITVTGNTMYTANYIPVNTLRYVSIYDISIPMTVSKQYIDKLTVPVITEKFPYSPNRRLSDIGLPENWSWDEPYTIPEVGTHEYNATYTAPDGVDLNVPRTTYPISITVVAADLKVPDDFTFYVTTGTKLSDIVLNTRTDGVYSFQEKDTTFNKVGSFTYHITFTPHDSNYNVVKDIPAYINVTAAQDDDQNVDIPTGLIATYGSSLASISLPKGWTWINPSESVGAVGDKIFAAIYKNRTYSVTVTVTKAPAPLVMTPADPDEIAWVPGLSTNYIALPLHWSFVNPGELAVGEHEYELIYTPVDTINYDYSGQKLTAKITVSVTKATPSYVFPAEITLTSGETLKNSLLPKSNDGKYVWMDEVKDSVIKESGNYNCKFVPTDTEHYYVVQNIPVSIKVKKAPEPEQQTTEQATTQQATTQQQTVVPQRQETPTTQAPTKPQTTTEQTTTEKQVSSSDIEIIGNNTEETTEVKVRPVVEQEDLGVIDTPSTTENSTTEEGTTEATQPEQEEGNGGGGALILLLGVFIAAGCGGYYIYKKKTSDVDEGM